MGIVKIDYPLAPFENADKSIGILSPFIFTLCKGNSRYIKMLICCFLRARSIAFNKLTKIDSLIGI